RGTGRKDYPDGNQRRGICCLIEHCSPAHSGNFPPVSVAGFFFQAAEVRVGLGDSRMHAWKRGLICLLLLCVVGHAAADWRTDVPQARLLGAGEFTWFGFSVYSARLFGEQTEQVFEQPFALELTYKRNI